MEKHPHLLVDSKLIEDYQMSSAIVAGSQACATTFDGRPALFSIGNDQMVHFTYRDAESQSGWRQEQLGRKASLIAACCSPDYGTMVWIASADKEHFDGNSHPMYAHYFMWRKPGEAQWSTSRKYGGDIGCVALRMKCIGSQILLLETFPDPGTANTYLTYNGTFDPDPAKSGFDLNPIRTDSLNLDIGIGENGEIGVYVLFTPQLYLKESPLEFLLNDQGNKAAEKHNLSIWRPLPDGPWKMIGHHAHAAHDYKTKTHSLEQGEDAPRLLAFALDDPSGTKPPILKPVDEFAHVYSDNNTGGNMDISIFRPKLSAQKDAPDANQHYRALSCFGFNSNKQDPTFAQVPAYVIHQDHAAPGVFFEWKNANTLYEPAEGGNALSIWHTDKCGGKMKCASVSAIKSTGHGEQVGAFWARSTVDYPQDPTAYLPALGGKESLLLFVELIGKDRKPSPWLQGPKWRLVQALGGLCGQLHVAIAKNEAGCAISYMDAAGSPQVLVLEAGSTERLAPRSHKDVRLSAIQTTFNGVGDLELFALGAKGVLYHIHHARYSEAPPGELLPVTAADARISSLALANDAAHNATAFFVRSTETSSQPCFLLLDPGSSNLSVQPVHADNITPQLIEIRAFNISITATDANEAPWMGELEVWTEGPALVKINGQSAYLDKELRHTARVATNGQCRISIPSNTLFAPVLHVWASFMDAQEYVTISPNAEIQYRLAHLPDDGLLKAQRNPLSSKATPLLPDGDADDMKSYAAFLRESMALLPDAHFEAEHKYLRLNREELAPKASRKAKPQSLQTLAPAQRMHFGLRVERGRAQFLRDHHTLAAAPLAKTSAHVFQGSWGDVWNFIKQAGQAVAESFQVVVKTIARGIQATLQFVVKGITYVFEGVAGLVQQVFSMVEGVFATIGLAFDDLVSWLGYLFDWDDILRTQRAVAHITNGGLDAGVRMLEKVKEALGGYLDQAKENFDAAMDQAAEALAPSQTLSTMLANNQDNATASSVGSHNIVANGIWDNAGDASTTPSPQGSPADPGLFDRLFSRFADFFGDEELEEIKETLMNMPTTVDAFMTTGLSSMVRVLRKVGDLALGVAKDLMEALMDLIIAQVIGIKEALNQSWEIPLVTALYRKVTGADGMSMLGVMSLAVAVPATPMFKLALGHAPFPTDKALDDFCTGYDRVMERILPSAERKRSLAQKASAQDDPAFFRIFYQLSTVVHGGCNFISMCVDPVLAVLPPPLPTGEDAPLIPKDTMLDKLHGWFKSQPRLFQVLGYVSSTADLIYNVFDFPMARIQKDLEGGAGPLETIAFPASLMGWATKVLLSICDLYTLKNFGYQLQHKGLVGVVINVLLGGLTFVVDTLGMILLEERSRSDYLSWGADGLRSLSRVTTILRYDKVVYASEGATLVVYAVLQAVLKAGSLALNTTALVLDHREGGKG